MPILEYKDRVTGETFEIFYNSLNTKEQVINENTGNISDRIYTNSNGFGGMDKTSVDKAEARKNYKAYKSAMK
jgi:hypothetical protein